MHEDENRAFTQILNLNWSFAEQLQLSGTASRMGPLPESCVPEDDQEFMTRLAGTLAAVRQHGNWACDHCGPANGTWIMFEHRTLCGKCGHELRRQS